MESLYVCLFSNGHIKVGRSVDPVSRIASHADRVACLGVELSDQFIVECVGSATPREQLLIARCAEAAEVRNQSEWFAGLNFLHVCDWALHAARDEITKTQRSNAFGERLCTARKARGLTQAQLGVGLGADGRDLQKAAISGWECGNYSPNVEQLRLLCERLDVSADWLVLGRINDCKPEAAAQRAV